MDVHPGDRAAACLGAMEPIAVEGTLSEYVLVHRCTKCGYEKRNKVAPNDDRGALVAVAKRRGAGDNHA